MDNMYRPQISVLVSARRNSKYLAKFIEGYKRYTSDGASIEMLVMLNEHDSWNTELVENFESSQKALFETVGLDSKQYLIRFYRENLQLGRAGLHEYFNELAKHARGDWLIYFCEDHFINVQNWDKFFTDIIDSKELNPNDVWCLVPKFDNVGAMNHMISRGYYNALGHKLGRHGWIDSYINDINDAIPDRVIRLDHETFHDFTHDQPNPMSDSHMQAVSTKRGEMLPEYKSEINNIKINEDKDKLLRAVEGEK